MTLVNLSSVKYTHSMPREFVSTVEIREMLGGISRQRVNELVKRDDFPEPVERLAIGNIWRAEDVHRWAKDHGRTIHED